MVIKIKIAELVEKIRDSYLAEASSIPEGASAGRTAGDVTEGEFERALINARVKLEESIFRFLHHDFRFNSGDVTPGGLSGVDYFSFDFCGTPRRLAGKQSIIANQSSNILIQLALAELFTPLNEEIGAKHNAIASDGILILQRLLYSKHKPIRHSV